MNLVCWWINVKRSMPKRQGAVKHSIREPRPFANNGEEGVVAAAPRRGSLSLKGSVDSRFVQQFRHALACVEHARLDGVLGHAEHPGDFLD